MDRDAPALLAWYTMRELKIRTVWVVVFVQMVVPDRQEESDKKRERSLFEHCCKKKQL